MKTDAESLIAKYGTGHRPGVPCAGTEKESLAAALHEKGVQWQRISEILSAEFQLEVDAQTLSRHYRKRCKCLQ